MVIPGEAGGYRQKTEVPWVFCFEIVVLHLDLRGKNPVALVIRLIAEHPPEKRRVVLYRSSLVRIPQRNRIHALLPRFFTKVKCR